MESQVVPSLRGVVLVENSKGQPMEEFKVLRKWEDVMRDGEGEILGARELAADECVNIQFTSGTTSMP